MFTAGSPLLLSLWERRTRRAASEGEGVGKGEGGWSLNGLNAQVQLKPPTWGPLPECGADLRLSILHHSPATPRR